MFEDIKVGQKPGAAIAAAEEQTWDEKLKLYQESLESQTINDFPLDVFPQKIQDIIKEWRRAIPYSKGWFGSYMISAASIAIGNTYGICYKKGKKNDHEQMMGGFYQKAGGYLAIVSNSSSGKSQLEKAILGPIKRRNERIIDAYERRLKNWRKKEEERKMRDYRERKADPQSFTPSQPDPEPINNQFIFDSFSIESLIRGHKNSPTGIAVLPDELTGWLKAMGKYNKSGGGDEEIQYMKFFNGGNLTINTLKHGLLNVKNCTVNIAGNMQPSVLKIMASGDKEASGFLARFLFDLSDFNGPPPTDKEMPHESVLQYERIINRIFDLPHETEKTEIEHDDPDFEEDNEIVSTNAIKTIWWQMTPKAKQVIFKLFTDHYNEKIATHHQSLKGMVGKMDSYVLRFAVALKALEIATDDQTMQMFNETDYPSLKYKLNNIEIDENLIMRAGRIAKYFMQNAAKAVDMLKDPTKTHMSEEQQKWYAMLPNDKPFRGSEAVRVAAQLGIDRRSTIYNWLKDKRFFTKDLKNSTYTKNY